MDQEQVEGKKQQAEERLLDTDGKTTGDTNIEKSGELKKAIGKVQLQSIDSGLSIEQLR